MGIFLGEVEEHIRALERDGLALENDAGAGRAELLKTLFRTAHSLKGAARSAGVRPIARACHRLEEILGAARDGAGPPDAALAQLLLAAADALADARGRLLAKQDPAGGALGVLLERLDTIDDPGGYGGHEASGQAGAAPLPGAAAPAAAAGGPAPSPAGAGMRDGLVRLPAAKLDTLVAQSGELLVARRRAAIGEEEVAFLRETMSRCVREWRHLEIPLRKLAAAESGASPGARAPGNGAGPPLPRRAARAVGDLAEHLKKLERGLDRLAQGGAASQHMLDMAASALEAEVRRARMLPFGDACEGLERAVRDLAKAAGKEVDLVLEGADVELDRAILDGLRDPLLHLVRNAVDHGVEPPAERIRAGKPACARITITAALHGDGVQVRVADDGRGLDLDAIRAQAAKRMSAVPEDERELVRLILLSGFSTTRRITELSGRGVGLDVVAHRVAVLHGSVDISFEPGRGACFALSLPLTLTTLRALLLGAGGQTFALPAANVSRLLRAHVSELGVVEGREVLLSGATPVPVVSLAAVIGLPQGHGPTNAGARVPLVVIASGGREVALAVDALLAEQEIVVKSLGERLRRVRHYAGATVLPTGKLALILAAADLVQTALGRTPGQPLAPAFESRAKAARKRILVVDDSVTTRSLEKSMLEAAGYEVVAATDGAEAWQILQERGADLVVADVEMPRMDGFTLTEAIRASRRFRDLPVVLVTSLETERDRTRGLEAGANAYLTKSAFDHQELLEVVAQLF